MNPIELAYHRFNCERFPLPSETQVRALEQRIKVELPVDYRKFILEFNGSYFNDPEITPVEDKLTQEAARVLKQKTSRYQRLLGIALLPPMQIYAEKFAIHYPTELYDNYTAAESESISNAVYRQNHTTQLARKNRTFYFNGLNADGFDDVITPVYNEPVVQCTLYLKVKYEVAQTKAK